MCKFRRKFSENVTQFYFLITNIAIDARCERDFYGVPTRAFSRTTLFSRQLKARR